MDACREHFAEAFAFALIERDALLAQDVEQVEKYAFLREEAICAALLAGEEGGDDAFLRESLVRMQQVQAELDATAQALYEKIRETLTVTRKQGRYFAGYRREITDANKSFYCDATS